MVVNHNLERQDKLVVMMVVANRKLMEIPAWIVMGNRMMKVNLKEILKE